MNRPIVLDVDVVRTKRGRFVVHTHRPIAPRPPVARPPALCLRCGGSDGVRDGECRACRAKRHAVCAARLAAGQCTWCGGQRESLSTALCLHCAATKEAGHALA